MNPFKLKTKVILGKDTRIKGTVIGHTMQMELNGKPQLYYLVRVQDAVLFNGLALSVLILHPDNVRSLDSENEQIAKELSKGVYNFGQSDGSGFQIKSNAPPHQVDLIMFELRKKKRDLTPKRLLKRLRKRGWLAEIKEAL